LRFRHRLQLQLPQPLSLISFCSSRSQWIGNGRADFSIRDGGRLVFKTAERSGSASNAGCEAGYQRRIESGCEVPPGAGVLRLLVPGMAVGVIIHRSCVADGVIVTR
jgi:hypothetical protein